MCFLLLYFSLEVLVKVSVPDSYPIPETLDQRCFITHSSLERTGRDSPAQPPLNVCQETHTSLDSKKHTHPWTQSPRQPEAGEEKKRHNSGSTVSGHYMLVDTGASH